MELIQNNFLFSRIEVSIPEGFFFWGGGVRNLIGAFLSVSRGRYCRLVCLEKVKKLY